MRFPRPQSLSGLIALGLVLVAVPLTFAIVHGASELRRLAAASEVLVRESVEVTRQNQSLQQYIVAMERSANMYALLDDPRLAEVFNRNQAGFDATLKALARLHPDAASRVLLEQLDQTSMALRQALLATDETAARRMAAAAGRFEQLNGQATQLATRSNAAIDARLGVLERAADDTQRQLFWTLAALAPAALGLALIFTYLVLRPLRQLDTAIAELGRGTFSRAVEVRGPIDLQVLGRQLEWLRLRLREIAQERSRFLRHMSHELKTPLANIREGTDLLLEGAVGELQDPQREVAGILRDNALRLQRLIENLLSFSAWQSQTVGLDLTEFPLKPLIRQVVDAQRLAIVARRLRLDLQLPDMTLHADRGKLRLVLDNLLSNAVKFSPRSGAIAIHARAEGDETVIDFADTGPGIPPAERARIFDAFYTGSTPQGGPLKGTGIGLSVVLEFVQAHGGRVELHDADMMYPGAHFRLRLPNRRPTTTAASHSTAMADPRRHGLPAVGEPPAATDATDAPPAEIAPTSADEDPARAA